MLLLFPLAALLASAATPVDYSVAPCTAPATCTIVAAAAGPDHSIYVTGVRTAYGATLSYVSRIDDNGTVAFVRTWGTPADEPHAIAVDSAGVAYIAGSTRSHTFPVKNAVQALSSPGSSGFVIALDLKGDVVFATYFGGTAYAEGRRVSNSTVNAIAIDKAGAIYVTGETNSPNVPTTAGLPHDTLGGGYGANAGAFVAKLAPRGTSIVYSGVFSGGGVVCMCCSSCDMSQRWVSGDAIAVDAEGNAWIGGSSNITQMSTTPNALFPTGMGGWVGRVAASGQRIDYLSFLTSSHYTLIAGGSGDTVVRALGVDGDGNAYVAGSTANPEFLTTPGAYQTIFHGSAQQGSTIFAPNEGFLMKFTPTGELRYSTLLGGSGNDAIRGLAIAPDGAAYLAARVESADFTVTSGATRGLDAIVVLDPTGASVRYSTRLPGGTADVGVPAADSARIFVAGSNSVSAISLSHTSPTLLALGDINTGIASSVVVPGQLVALYGDHLTISTALTAVAKPGERLPTTLGGMQVLFDGVPASLVSVAPGQILALVPANLTPGTTTKVRVSWVASMFATGTTDERTFQVLDSLPSAFQDATGNAIFGEDGAAATHVTAGSILTAWINGAGVHVPAEGFIAPEASAYDPACCRVWSDDWNAPAIETTYVGAAPGLPSSIVQVNFRAPRSGKWTVRIGSTVRLAVNVDY